jgi:toxin ParE1/3/4
LQQADRYIDLLNAAFAELASLSMPGYRRYRVDRHMIYFRITPYGIAVIRTLHDRMDAPRNL